MTRHWWLWVVYGVIFITVSAGHIVWFRTTHDPAIWARFGTTLIGLGIIVAAQPFFRTGFLEAVNRQMPGRYLSGTRSQLSSFSNRQRNTKSRVLGLCTTLWPRESSASPSYFSEH